LREELAPPVESFAGGDLFMARPSRIAQLLCEECLWLNRMEDLLPANGREAKWEGVG
jgi:hypothetical protein